VAARQQQPDYFNRLHLVGSSSSASTILYIIKIFVSLRRQESSGSSKSSDRGTIDQAQQSHQLADYNSVEAKSTGLVIVQKIRSVPCIFMACVKGKKRSSRQVRKLSASNKFFFR
jgi:hypothetical protein